MKIMIINIIFLFFINSYSQNVFEETKFSLMSSYDKENKLEIKCKNRKFVFAFVEDRAYLYYLNDNRRITTWKRIAYNFNYDSSFEEAEEHIRMLCNNSEGFLLLPNITEEFPIYAVYFFDNEKFIYLENVTTNNHNCLKQNHKIKIHRENDQITYKVYDEKSNFICNLIKESKSILYKEKDDLKKINALMKNLLPLQNK